MYKNRLLSLYLQNFWTEEKNLRVILGKNFNRIHTHRKSSESHTLCGGFSLTRKIHFEIVLQFELNFEELLKILKMK